MSVRLEISGPFYHALHAHLLRPRSSMEEAAFLFAEATQTQDELRAVVREMTLLSPAAFEFRSPQYLELTDQTRRSVIKRAHDLGSMLVEVHSHPLYSACFSASDRRGLNEFVPHIWWRLKGKPYMAVVVAPNGFDAVAWVSSPDTPEAVNSVIVEGTPRYPTGLSLPWWSKEIDDAQPSL